MSRTGPDLQQSYHTVLHALLQIVQRENPLSSE
jgi:hypothetical protein